MEDVEKTPLDNSPHSLLKFQIWLVVAMIIWGLSWSNAKVLGQYVPAQVLMFWRFFFAAMALVPILIYFRMSVKISRHSLPPLLFCAVMITTYNYYYFTGTHLGLSGAGGVLVTTINPILTTLFVFVISKNPLSQREGFGLLAGLLGGLILLEIWNQQVEQMVNGATGMFLICALTWSCITIVSPRALVSMHIFVYSFWIFLLASMFSLPIAWPIGINLVFIPIPIFWINMIIVSLGSLSFATSLYFIATKRLGPDKAASFVFVVPVSAMGFSMVIFSEPLQWHTLIGGSIAILAVYLINSGKSHKVLTNVPATQ